MGKPPSAPPPLPPFEQRRHARVQLFVQLQVSSASEVHLLRARNLSLGGAFVEARNTDCPDIQVGGEVEIVVFALGEDGAEVRCRAWVLRYDPGRPGQGPGFGLAFVDLDPREKARLENLVQGAEARQALPPPIPAATRSR